MHDRWVRYNSLRGSQKVPCPKCGFKCLIHYRSSPTGGSTRILCLNMDECDYLGDIWDLPDYCDPIERRTT